MNGRMDGPTVGRMKGRTAGLTCCIEVTTENSGGRRKRWEYTTLNNVRCGWPKSPSRPLAAAAPAAAAVAADAPDSPPTQSTPGGLADFRFRRSAHNASQHAATVLPHTAHDNRS